MPPLLLRAWFVHAVLFRHALLLWFLPCCCLVSLLCYFCSLSKFDILIYTLLIYATLCWFPRHAVAITWFSICRCSFRLTTPVALLIWFSLMFAMSSISAPAMLMPLMFAAFFHDRYFIAYCSFDYTAIFCRALSTFFDVLSALLFHCFFPLCLSHMFMPLMFARVIAHWCLLHLIAFHIASADMPRWRAPCRCHIIPCRYARCCRHYSPCYIILIGVPLRLLICWFRYYATLSFFFRGLLIFLSRPPIRRAACSLMFFFRYQDVARVSPGAIAVWALPPHAWRLARLRHAFIRHYFVFICLMPPFTSSMSFALFYYSAIDVTCYTMLLFDIYDFKTCFFLFLLHICFVRGLMLHFRYMP